jgi:hypothetical protein
LLALSFSEGLALSPSEGPRGIGGSSGPPADEEEKISKNRMATLLKTSRTQVDRLLNPKSDITLSSLQRAAAMVGRRVMIELV